MDSCYSDVHIAGDHIDTDTTEVTHCNGQVTHIQDLFKSTLPKGVKFHIKLKGTKAYRYGPSRMNGLQQCPPMVKTLKINKRNTALERSGYTFSRFPQTTVLKERVGKNSLRN